MEMLYLMSHRYGLSRSIVTCDYRSVTDLFFNSSFEQGCTILSGDVIIRHLAAHLKPEYVVFLVSFLYDLDSSYVSIS